MLAVFHTWRQSFSLVTNTTCYQLPISQFGYESPLSRAGRVLRGTATSASFGFGLPKLTKAKYYQLPICQLPIIQFCYKFLLLNASRVLRRMVTATALVLVCQNWSTPNTANYQFSNSDINLHCHVLVVFYGEWRLSASFGLAKLTNANYQFTNFTIYYTI